MKKTFRSAAAVLMVIILISSPSLLAWGNPVPGRWEKVAETRPRDWMVIYAQDGSQHKYRFVSLNDEFLTCRNDNGEQYQYELAGVDKIVLPKAAKYAKEWALWGAVGGAIGGAVFPAATDPSGFDSTTGGYVAFAGIGAILGALGGGIAGAVLGAPGETVYISKEAALAAAK